MKMQIPNENNLKILLVGTVVALFYLGVISLPEAYAVNSIDWSNASFPFDFGKVSNPPAQNDKNSNNLQSILEDILNSTSKATNDKGIVTALTDPTVQLDEMKDKDPKKVQCKIHKILLVSKNGQARCVNRGHETKHPGFSLPDQVTLDNQKFR